MEKNGIFGNFAVGSSNLAQKLPSLDLHTAVSPKTFASLLKHFEFSELSCLIDFIYPAEQYISIEN
jgi:hypothetical protein